MLNDSPSTHRMLLVEHDTAIATAVERAGETLALSVERATDGWDAIGKLEENEYDVIVVDLDVPQSSGFGVVTFLRQEYGPSLSNVILVTDREKRAVEAKYPAAAFRIVRKTDSTERWADLLGGATSRE